MLEVVFPYYLEGVAGAKPGIDRLETRAFPSSGPAKVLATAAGPGPCSAPRRYRDRRRSAARCLPGPQRARGARVPFFRSSRWGASTQSTRASFVVERLDPPFNTVDQYAVFEKLRYPSPIVIDRPVVEEAPRVIGDVSFHRSKDFALIRPSSVQFPPMGEEVDVEDSSAGMTKEMSLVDQERLLSESSSNGRIHVGKAPDPRRIPPHRLDRGYCVRQNHPFCRVIKEIHPKIEDDLGQVARTESGFVLIEPSRNLTIPRRKKFGYWPNSFEHPIKWHERIVLHEASQPGQCATLESDSEESGAQRNVGISANSGVASLVVNGPPFQNAVSPYDSRLPPAAYGLGTMTRCSSPAAPSLKS